MTMEKYQANVAPDLLPAARSEVVAKAQPGIRRLYVVLDGTFSLKNGKPSSYNMDYAFFSRYLNSFDAVVVVARLFPEEEPSTNLIEGPNVSFMALPGYRRALMSLLAVPKLLWTFLQIGRDRQGIVMVRLPSTAGNIAGHVMAAMGKPFGLELVGDPAHAYSSESLGNSSGRFFQWLFTASCRYLCQRAKTVSYVTQEALQRDYPAGETSHTAVYTSLDLPLAGFAQAPKTAADFSSSESGYRLVQVAMMPTWYKGHDISLAMIADFKKRGMNVHLRLIGDGRLRPELEEMVQTLDIADRVTFAGQVKSGADIWSELDRADMLILPSRQEGLPRVVIEAMARGLPCVANNIGGTAEILDDDQMVEELTVEVFRQKVERNLTDVELLVEQSARNLAVARNYQSEAVQARRDICFQALKSGPTPKTAAGAAYEERLRSTP